MPCHLTYPFHVVSAVPHLTSGSVIANPDGIRVWQSRLKLLRLPRHPRQERGAPRNDRPSEINSADRGLAPFIIPYQNHRIKTGAPDGF